MPAQNPWRSGFGDPPGGDKSFCCQQTMHRVEITTMHDAENAEEETLIKDVYTYLTRKSYPADCPGNMKRIIRRKALKFQVTENGELYYKHNQKGQVRTQYMNNIYACTYCINILIKNLPTRHAVYCRSILLACHVDPTSGHMGKSRTIFRIKERFMWHGMVKDVADLVSGRLEEYIHI